jgi:metal-sulfur cluster biosynthetic enzyme
MQDRERMPPRLAEVWARLDLVTDPELDDSITDMDFVEAVDVGEDGHVLVCFRLPTYWCSPNFAFLMAEGIRNEVGRLPWVSRVSVRLEDHMCAEEMNAAVNDRRSFADAFALREDGGDLSEVKEKFERKAFQRRQEAVLIGLKRAGLAPREAAAMTLADLDATVFDDPEARRQAPRYLALLVERGLAGAAGDHAFPGLDGAPLTEAGYAERMGTLRAVRINMEFGGALCRGLKASRYCGDTQPAEAASPGGPSLVDFILERVPPRAAAGG